MANPSDVALRKLEQILSRDPLLRDVFAQTLPKARRSTRFVPEVDVVELDDRYLVHVELPGVPRDGLTVDIEDGRLVVAGDKPIFRPADGSTRVSERRGGPFRREFLVPTNVIPEQVTARLDRGVLVISLPRRVGGAVRSVEIE